ncbi:ribokinase [Altericista sp. CCNU0014]|uniref:ribokinase n=1 Tax=Altericista sp. CCNU0014 TaxID=3082949 RepID=UPI00384C4823
MAICVFGSLNLDLVLRTPHLPKAGETLSSSTFETVPGGKGANQAVAAARLGTLVHLVGRVGADGFGQQLVAALLGQGVACDGIFEDASARTGIAAITVADGGENQIVLAAGANGLVGAADIERLKPKLPGASALLLQLEIPLQAAISAAKAARDAGVKVILDPAPAPAEFPAEFYSLVDILTPNQTEAEQLLGQPIRSVADALQGARSLQQKGVERVILTLGDRGIAVADGSDLQHWPAYPSSVCDTTAAGDAFNGALAAALDRNHSWTTALQWGLAAGALAVSQAGAQPSLPTRASLLDFLQAHS